MRGSLLALLLFSACYSPSFATGAPCTTDSECPDTQKCLAMACNYESQQGSGSNIDDAPMTSDADRDKDGVADATDNCPDLANADQSNVDGDGRGDACDLCPLIKSDSDLDADKDGVGDACDPNPAAKDTVWAFSAFHPLPTWTKSPAWTAGDGGGIVTAPGGTADDDEYMIVPFTPVATPIDKLAASMTFKVTAEAGAQGDHDIGFDIYDSSNKHVIYCFVQHDPVNANAVLYLSEYDANDNATGVQKNMAYGWVQNMDYRIRMSRQGTTYACTVVGPDGTMATVSGTSNSVPRDGTAIELWAFGLTAQVHSVQLVGAAP